MKENEILASVIVPAFNEEKRVGELLRILNELPDNYEIIVIDDGSKDGTAGEARNFLRPIVISHPKNQGKAKAMKTGLSAASGKYVLFLDADLRGLRVEDILSITKRTMQKDADIVVAKLLSRENRGVRLSQIWFPFISGIQMARSETWWKIVAEKDFEKSRFKAEREIKRIAKELGLRTIFVDWPEVTQYTKEEKLGIFRAIPARLKMYFQMIRP